MNIVVGHRFTGPSFINNNSANPLDVKYDESLPGDVAFRRGSSINGWSYSATGAVWQAPGKVYPQFVWGEQIAILWSDPALAVGRTNQSLVAYASLAVSKQAFDAVAGRHRTSSLDGRRAISLTVASLSVGRLATAGSKLTVRRRRVPSTGGRRHRPSPPAQQSASLPLMTTAGTRLMPYCFAWAPAPADGGLSFVAPSVWTNARNRPTVTSNLSRRNGETDAG